MGELQIWLRHLDELQGKQRVLAAGDSGSPFFSPFVLNSDGSSASCKTFVGSCKTMLLGKNWKNELRALFRLEKLSGPVQDTPPYRAIPFRDRIAEGGIAPICLVCIGYRASIAEIPLLRGGIAPPLRMLSKGETLRKGEGA